MRRALSWLIRSFRRRMLCRILLAVSHDFARPNMIDTDLHQRSSSPLSVKLQMAVVVLSLSASPSSCIRSATSCKHRLPMSRSSPLLKSSGRQDSTALDSSRKFSRLILRTCSIVLCIRLSSICPSSGQYGLDPRLVPAF